MFGPDDVLRVDGERIAADVIDGEAIVINLETGVYYSLDRVGAVVWSLVSGGSTFGAVVDRVVERFDVDRDRASGDIQRLLESMTAERLVDVGGAVEAFVAADDPPTNKADYAVPELQAYRDLGDLLALDPPAPGMNRIAWSERRGDEE